MSYKLVLAPRAVSDLEIIKKSGDKSRINKLRKIFEELMEHPFSGTGKPEALKNRPDTYSRRLNARDRVVYSVHDDIVQVNVLQALGHYDDK